MPLRTVEWIADAPPALVPGHIRLIDQTKLPLELVFLNLGRVEEIWHAIKILQVRGAPAIGIAAAMGVVLGAQAVTTGDSTAVVNAIHQAADSLATSRPTAVNLFWALDRMRRTAVALRHLPPAELKENLAGEAQRIWDEDLAMCRAIGRHGATLLQDVRAILTHCNAGGLATSQFGTALAPVYVAQEQGRQIKVYSDETRPLLQGSRLTAWELMQAGIEVTVICDNMAGQVMKEGRIDAVLVGADRIAANGDAANKIGTYGVAVLAHYHRIPFYVLAPTSTFDLRLETGGQIPIEERDPKEITCGFAKRTAPEGVSVYAPAFDVTPSELTTAIVCENGIAHPPYREALRQLTAPLADRETTTDRARRR